MLDPSGEWRETASIISLSGFAGAGKDFVAQRLVDRMFVRVAFADPLKASAAAGLGVTVEELDALKDRDLDARRLLQRMGDVYREVLGKGFFVDSLMTRVWNLMSDGYDVVVTDARYRTEIEALRGAGARMVWIEAPQKFLRKVPGHSSESEMQEMVEEGLFDIVVHNDRVTPVEDIVKRMLQGGPYAEI